MRFITKLKQSKLAWWTLGSAVVLQIYFVRELLAAEALFAVFFTAIFCAGVLVYAAGRMGERGFGWAEARLRVLGESVRRGLAWRIQ